METFSTKLNSTANISLGGEYFFTSQQLDTHLTSVLVIGLGNPILGDDGIGWRVLEEIQRSLPDLVTRTKKLEIKTEFLSLGGLSLMEHLVGNDFALIIDSIQTGTDSPGTVREVNLDELSGYSTGHSTNVHDLSLFQALEFGKIINLDLPHHIDLVTIEIRNSFEFSDELTLPVLNSIQSAKNLVINKLMEMELTHGIN